MNEIVKQLQERIGLAEREKEVLMKELQQANKLRAMGAMAAGIAHEINTPVQFVSDNTRYVSKAADDIFTFVGSVRYNLENWEEQKVRVEDKKERASQLDVIYT